MPTFPFCSLSIKEITRSHKNPQVCENPKFSIQNIGHISLANMACDIKHFYEIISPLNWWSTNLPIA